MPVEANGLGRDIIRGPFCLASTNNMFKLYITTSTLHACALESVIDSSCVGLVLISKMDLCPIWSLLQTSGFIFLPPSTLTRGKGCCQKPSQEITRAKNTMRRSRVLNSSGVCRFGITNYTNERREKEIELVNWCPDLSTLRATLLKGCHW